MQLSAAPTQTTARESNDKLQLPLRCANAVANTADLPYALANRFSTCYVSAQLRQPAQAVKHSTAKMLNLVPMPRLVHLSLPPN